MKKFLDAIANLDNHRSGCRAIVSQLPCVRFRVRCPFAARKGQHLLRNCLAIVSFRIVKELSAIPGNTPKRKHTQRVLALAHSTRKRHGGGERDRTDDPLLAKQVLSQLSYTPVVRAHAWWVWLGSNQRPPPYQDGALTS